MSSLADWGVGAATSMGAFDPAKPENRFLSTEVPLYYQQMGNIYGAAQQWSPQFAGIYNQQNRESLLGQNGLVNLYAESMPTLQNASNQAMASQYGTQMGLYGQGMKSASKAAKQANPEYWQGLSNITGEAQRQMNLGSNLDPNEQRKIMQNYYAQSPMHGAGGSADQFGAAIASYLGGQQLRQQRFQNLQSAYGQYGAALPQLAAPNVNQAGYGMAAAPGLFQQSGAPMGYAQGQIGTPFNQYAADVYNTNMGATWDYEKYKSQLRQSGFNQGASGMMGTAMAGGMMCWVAREVYGADNPNWVLFRYWMMNMAPVWFKALYLRFGQRMAKWISNKPRIKKLIRRWMDSKLEEVRTPYAVVRWI